MSAFAGILVVVVGISSVILVHEFGHFLFARLCGVRVERFSIGLGSELVGICDRFGTRLSISAIPIAGFIRFCGSTGSHETKAAGIPYNQSSIANRFSIVLAGPLFSIIFAYLLSAASIYWYSNALEPVIGAIAPDGPAERAGLKAGDRILSINGNKIRSFADTQVAVQYSQENTLAFVFKEPAQLETSASHLKRRN